jgi:hypothetical protein
LAEGIIQSKEAYKISANIILEKKGERGGKNIYILKKLPGTIRMDSEMEDLQLTTYL